MGLSALSTFSWSKALTIGSEIADPNPGTAGSAVVNNVFDRSEQVHIDLRSTILVQRFVELHNTQIGSNKLLSTLLSNWTYRWADPSGMELMNFKLAQTTQSNGNTSAGFGRVVTTGFTSTQNYYQRQGVLVGRLTF